MKRLISTSLAIFIFFCMLIATERQAFGYVDPGSGILALQSLASVLAAFAYFLRRRIRLLFSRNAASSETVMAREGKSANAA
jgi:hypothetical protein